MFRTALRISALMLIVVGAYFCGRETKQAKSESKVANNIVVESSEKCVTAKKTVVESIEKSIATKNPIIDEGSEKCFEIGALAKGKKNGHKIEFTAFREGTYTNPHKEKTLPDITPPEMTSWACSDGDMHYLLEYDEKNDCFTYRNERLNKDWENRQEIFIIYPGFAR